MSELTKKQRKIIRKREGFFSPRLAVERPLDELVKDEEGKKARAWGMIATPFANLFNDIRIARGKKMETGQSVAKTFFKLKGRDLKNAVPVASKVVSSYGFSVVGDVVKGITNKFKKKSK